MSKIGLFYASESGNTEKIAKRIQRDHFDPGTLDIHDLQRATAESFGSYDALIIGTPTVGMGDYPDALDGFLPTLQAADLTGKTVALFGLGDQENYSGEFVDALGMVHEEIESRGATIIGYWPTDGYDYEFSKADLGDGQFCGLVLDVDNQPELTSERLATWIAEVKPALLASLA